MARDSTGYTIGFAVAVCVICGIGVAGAAVALGPRQAENKVLDQQKQVLLVAGLMKPGQQATPEEVTALFTKNIRREVITLKTGAEDKAIKAETFDQRRAQKDPATSTTAPENAAKVFRLPNNALVYHVLKDGKTDTLILPIEGYGLWSVLYGYLAVDKDANTIKGITFYAHAETPGLGGEVDNPKWKAPWPGARSMTTRASPPSASSRAAPATPRPTPTTSTACPAPPSPATASAT
ncbi:NADH:ubiquinone reductase (Na(+)-transporting) subunit C [Nannocystis sp.]|uniref:NADH:ubiquinone reductase (Na(+)-transporting) subunit C n=1 Tax=Nannocystis sp. TaxID=1962667 RepID=UPI00344C9D78